MRWLGSIIDSMDISLSKLWQTVKVREAWCAGSMGSQRVRHDLVIEQEVNIILVNGRVKRKSQLYVLRVNNYSQVFEKFLMRF